MNIFPVILSAAMVLAVLHMVAPDHWIPLTVVSKKFNYSSSKTYETALLIGILHSAASVALAVVAYYLGELLVSDSLYFLYLSSVILLIIVGIYFIFNGYFEKSENPESSALSSKSILTVSIFPDFAFIPIMLAASALHLIQFSGHGILHGCHPHLQSSGYLSCHPLTFDEKRQTLYTFLPQSHSIGIYDA